MKTHTNNMARAAIGKTAAIANYLIERVNTRRVDLCQSQGDAWVTIERNIDRRSAELSGFNLESPEVETVFAGL